MCSPSTIPPPGAALRAELGAQEGEILFADQTSGPFCEHRKTMRGCCAFLPGSSRRMPNARLVLIGTRERVLIPPVPLPRSLT